MLKTSRIGVLRTMVTSLRVPYSMYITDKEFERHLSLIKDQTHIQQEIALFTEYAHRGYWPLEGYHNLVQVLKRRIAAYKQAGFASVGLNVLCTLGHLDDSWDMFEKPVMQTAVAIDGYEFRTCLCPTSGEFRAYIAEKFRILAEARPDFIWIDDDFKLKNHGGREICFCPKCIEKFNQRYCLRESFEGLTQSLKTDPDGTLSVKWRKFGVDNLTEIATIMKEAIHSVDPGIKTGMMTVPDDHFPENVTCFEDWMGALAATKGRPGSGFYTDATPTSMLPKFLFCEYQLAHYPPSVTDRQYEYETFPAQDFTKAKTIVKMEFLYGLMEGCNGIALSGTLAHNNGEMAPFDSRYVLEENATLFDAVAERAVKLPNCGIYCSDFFETGPRFMELELPMSGDYRAAVAYVLIGQAPNAYTDEELLKLLSGSVVLDTKALDILEKRGMAKYCGVRSSKYYDHSIVEWLSDSWMNGDYKGWLRDAWVNFAGREVCASALELLDEKVEILSDLKSLCGEYYGPCMTAYENELGGRVAVCTYLFPNSWQFESKRTQWTNLFDWLIPGGLPVKVNLPHKIVPVMRKDSDGNCLLMLTNMTFDTAYNFAVDIAANDLKMLRADGTLQDIQSKEVDGKTRVLIEKLKPWESILLTNFW